MNDTIKQFLVGLGFSINEAELAKFTDGIATASTRAAALGAVTTAASVAIVAGVSKVAAEFNQLDLLAQKYNATASKIDDFVDSAEMVGIGGEAAENALEAMNKVVGEAALGIGRGKIILEKLGIQAKDTAGKVRPVTEVMGDLQSKLATMDRGQAMAIMQKLGLDPQLLRMFNGELGNIQKITEEMAKTDKSVGLDFDQAIQESKKFQASMISMKTEARLLFHWFTTLWESLAVKLMPKVRAGLDRMGQTFEGLRHKLQENGKRIVEAISPILNVVLRVGEGFIKFLARGIEVVNTVIETSLGLWGKLQDITGGMAGKIILVIAAWKYLNLSFLKSPLGMLVALAAGALLLYDDFMTWKEGGESLIDWGSDFGEMLMYGASLVVGLGVAILATNAIMAAYSIMMNVVTIAMGAWQAVLKTLQTGMLLFNLIMAANPIGLVVVAIMALIAAGALLVANWDTVKTWFSGFFGWFEKKWSKLSEMTTGMMDSLGEFFGGDTTITAKPALANVGNVPPRPNQLATAQNNLSRITPSQTVVAPTPQARATMNSTQSVAQTTNINVAGGSNPQATAQAVATAQGSVNKNMARNMKGAVK